MGSVMAEDKDDLLEKLKRTIRKEEGLKLDAYKPDKREKFNTIGYGHYSANVKDGARITKDKAEELLDKDIKSRLTNIRKSIKNYDKYPEETKKALFSSWYRGSLSGSPKTIDLLNKGKYEEASSEFLNNDEYRRRVKEGNMKGVINRMENTSNQILNINKGRSPQSVDTVSKTDSSILKEEPMIKKEDEEEKTNGQKIQEFAKGAMENSPLGQNLPTHSKKALQKKLVNPDNLMSAAADSQREKLEGKKPEIKNEFMEALTYFLPSIVGLGVGHAIGGGEGAAQGAQLGMKAGEGYRQTKLAREKFEFQKQQAQQPNAMAQERLKVQKSNLELRKQEVEEQRKRTNNLEEDRDLRREERKLSRQITAKESFGKRGDVKKLQDQGLLLNDINIIVSDTPEIAAGVIGFKIAKGIAGEVGNLTQAEREDAQISPSFYRKLKRGGTKFLTGRLPEEDVKELRKVVKIMEKKRKEKLGSVIDGFTKSRYKGDDAFRQDLRNEFGVEENKEQGKKTPQTSQDKFNSWDEEKRKRYLEYKARRGK